MNVDKRILYSLVCSLFAIVSFCLFLPVKFTKYILLIILLIYSFLVCYFIKKRKILSIHKSEVAFILLLVSTVYIMLFYLTGLEFGFHQTLYPFSKTSLFQVILPIGFITICSEIIRYVFLAQDNKQVKYISFVLFVLIDYVMMYNIYSFTSLNATMDIIGLLIFPSITLNFLCHYLSENYGYWPGIIYRLIMNLYIYLIPVAPLMPDSLDALSKLFYPLIILWFIKLLYQQKKSAVNLKSVRFANISFAIIMIFMVCLVMIVSNKFRFGSIVIATPSMEGEINVGDMIIYERIDSDDVVSVGQVIVYEKDDIIIVHRVDEVEYIDGVLRYYTKGDANENRDSGYITRDNIIGITDFKVAYVGYPTLWLLELFEND